MQRPFELRTTMIKKMNKLKISCDSCTQFGCRSKCSGSQARVWVKEVTSPAIVGLNTFLVRSDHLTEGLSGLFGKLFGAMVKQSNV